VTKGTKPEEAGTEIDRFWLQRVYPDASAAFEFEQADIGDVKNNAFIVLDANVLLLPYRLGAHSLAEIKKVFGELSQQDRVFLPGQAVREYLKNRAAKLRDITRDLSNQASQMQIIADKKIGFLENDPDYQNLVQLSEQVKTIKSDTLKAIEKISTRLKGGIGSDPVSSVYREIFIGRVV
jgi:hypothetical protein